MTNARTPQVECAPETIAALCEVFERELRHRRLFVIGQFQFTDRQPCTLVVRHPLGAVFGIDAEAVYVKREEPAAGVGLDLVGLDALTLDALTRFVSTGASPAQAARSDWTPNAPDAASTTHGSVPLVEPSEGEAAAALEHTGIDDGVKPSECPIEPEPRPASASTAADPTTMRLFDRIRKLTSRQRENVAREGLLTERVALERTFGGCVWEGLLQNPQISLPEVARIARNGTLPMPLVSVIVANAAWLQSAEVRRALLSNPRVSGAHLERVLKALPRAELKLLAHVSSYRSQVRMAAKRLLGER